MERIDILKTTFDTVNSQNKTRSTISFLFFHTYIHIQVGMNVMSDFRIYFKNEKFIPIEIFNPLYNSIDSKNLIPSLNKLIDVTLVKFFRF